MPKLTRKTAILIKLESSYGTDPTPTGAANYLEVTELSAEPVVSDEVNREVIRPYLGNSEVLLANTRVNLNFTVEMVGSGTAGTAAKWDAAILSCGTSKNVVSNTSVTYTPESTTTWDSCTIWYYTDGVRHQAKGCRGTFSINCEVGQIPTISFSMTGIYVAPTDTAIPTVTRSNQASPVIFTNGNTSAVSLMGWTGAAIQSWSFDMNNATTYRELVGGTKEVLITERTPSGSVVVEAPALSTHNFFTDATGSSTGTNTWQHSGGAGNIITVSCPQTDLGAPSYSDSDGIVMLNLPFMATPTSAGNNEFSLVCT